MLYMYFNYESSGIVFSDTDIWKLHLLAMFMQPTITILTLEEGITLESFL